ncbi:MULTISPECIES: SAM hydrolase/SAM-dependent halogenase family protein [Chitinophagaceae]
MMSILTLSTDIGLNDYVVGAIKGQLVAAVRELNIVDITHYLSSSNYPQSSYICGNAIKYYPKGTIHVIILNLFENSPERLLIAKYKDQIIACPDNGILTMITNEVPKEMVSVQVDTSKSLTTLHFTQTLAQTVALLHQGKDLHEIGQPIENIVEKYSLRATIGADWIEGQIIFIDHYENVVVNITKEEFEEHRANRNFQIVFTRSEIINQISENYASVNVGEKFAWFNSAGFLEIAINKGNVAGLFGLQGVSDAGVSGTSQQNNWFYKTVRIYFTPIPEEQPLVKSTMPATIL